MKKFVILVAICICICICLVIPALAADEGGTSVSNADIYKVDDDTVIPQLAVYPGNPDDRDSDDPDDRDVYEVDGDTWVIGPPIAAPEPPEPKPMPAPMPEPEPVPPAPPSGAPRPAEIALEPDIEPVIWPGPEPEPEPDCGVGPAIDPEPMPPRDDYEPTQESLEDILGLDEIFDIPFEEYTIIERERDPHLTPAIEPEPRWAFDPGTLSLGSKLNPAGLQLVLTSSRHGAGQLRVVKVGNKLYFLGLRPGSKLILVDTTSLEIIRIVDVVRPTLSVDKPFAGKRILAILVDENLVYQSSRVIG